jgi:hypothetical protein
MCKTSNYLIMLILFLLLITFYLYYLKNKKANESFINENTQFCGSFNDSSSSCNKNSSCNWTTISGKTSTNGNTQSSSFCAVRNQS